MILTSIILFLSGLTIIGSVLYWVESPRSIAPLILLISAAVFLFVSLLFTTHIDRQVLHKNIDYQVVCLPVDDTTGVPDKVVIYTKNNQALVELTNVAAVKAFRVADSITVETPLTIYGIRSADAVRYYASVTVCTLRAK